jgi:fengycin family lipopeptide synthetase D
MTYRQLNDKSNQLARYLREAGVKPDSFVGIMIEKSLELIIGIMAILKSGGAYLPIDPEYPKERVELLTKDCDVNILLSRKNFLEKAPEGCKLVDLNNPDIYSFDTSNLSSVNTSTDLAYIIFTSGSTGNPKGVMIEHKNLVNQITGLAHKLGFDSSYNHILLAKITFDVSVQHIFVPLVTGAKLFIPDDNILKNLDRFWEFVYENRIDVINTVPAFLDTLLDNISVSSSHRLKFIMVGGDIFKKKLLDKIKSTVDVEKIVNIYGPTECTINATLYLCEPDFGGDTIPIGSLY